MNGVRSEIRGLLRDVSRGDRSRQKTIRARLRRLGLYISDFSHGADGFTPSDLDELIQRRTIVMDDSESRQGVGTRHAPRASGRAHREVPPPAASNANQRAGSSGSEPAFSREALTARGFEGWVTFSALRHGAIDGVPDIGGIYVVSRPSQRSASFLDSRAIGFAGLREFMRFGAGEPIGHWGGRLIWQITDADDLLVAWMPTPDERPVEVESRLIDEFRGEDGSRRLPTRRIGSACRPIAGGLGARGSVSRPQQDLH